MFPLLAEIHFWSLTDNEFSSVMDTQLSVHRYHSSKEQLLTTLSLGKKEYIQRKGYRWCLPNKRPLRLRESLKELQASFISECMVRAQWISCNTCVVSYNSGLMIAATINLTNGDLSEIVIDKFLKDKLQWDSVCDVIIKEKLVVCCSSEHKLSVIQFDKCLLDGSYVRLSNLDTKMTSVELPAPVGRRLVRRLVINKSSELIAVWWSCDDDDVYPWSANVREVDRCNLHVYDISGCSSRVPQLMCYHRTEYNSLNVLFSHRQCNFLYIIQQRLSSSKVQVNVYIDKYEVIKNCQLQKHQSYCISVNGRIISAQLSPDERKMLLCCVDGSLALYNHSTSLTHYFTSPFVAKIVRWHANSQLFIIASTDGQIQMFDFALNCLKLQMVSEDITPCNVLDISCYFKDAIELFDVKWNDMSQHCFLLVILKEGPIGILKMTYLNSITCNVLVQHYLQNNQIDRACCLLLAINWNCDAKECYMILKNIVHHIISKATSSQYIIQQYEHLECALCSYYNPIEEITDVVQMDYSKLVKNLTRVVTHKLIRYEIYDKAFTLICMLDDHDLYMDLYYSCIVTGNATLAAAAWNRAQNHQQLFSDSNSDSCDCFECDCGCASPSYYDHSTSALNEANKHTSSTALFRTAILKPLNQNATTDTTAIYENHETNSTNIDNIDNMGNMATSHNHNHAINRDEIIIADNKKAIKVVHFGVV